MRAYFFGNMYLSSIQQGIQAGHCISELFNKYQSNNPRKTALFDWAANHKTMILLNAGYASTLIEFTEFLHDPANTFPFAPFHESDEALNGAPTSTGIILPERIYETASAYRRSSKGWMDLIVDTHDDGNTIIYVNQTQWILTPWERELVERLTRFGLAK